MTLPDYTLRLIEERYSEEAMKAWRLSLRYAYNPDLSALNNFVAAIQQFGAALAAALRPRPVYAPSSPLTLALLKELYGGPA